MTYVAYFSANSQQLCFCVGNSTGGLYINGTEWRGQVRVGPLLNTRSLCVCPAQETEGSPRLTRISIHSFTHIHMCKVSTQRTSHDFIFHSRTFWWTLSLNRSDEVQRNKGGGIGGLEKPRALDREREREVGVHTPLSKNNILTERLAIWIFWTQDYGWCLNLFFPLLPMVATDTATSLHGDPLWWQPPCCCMNSSPIY